MLNDMADGKCCFRFSDSFDSNSVPQNLKMLIERFPKKFDRVLQQQVHANSAQKKRILLKKAENGEIRRPLQLITFVQKLHHALFRGKADCPRKDKENIFF